jgi:uncharacterized protein YbjT (DUF2867 family)
MGRDRREQMKCVVFGATGYLGTRLIPELLAAGHSVRTLARYPAKLDRVPWRDQVDVLRGDVTDAISVRQTLAGQQVLYYLVHSLERSDFVEVDHRAAKIVGASAAEAGLSRIVYVGGIVPKGQQLSEHLASRAQVGESLRASGVPTVELRAAAIIGAGSASFEMLRYLTDRLPLIIAPRWLSTRVQPISVRDALYYLVHAAQLPAGVNRPFDIGAPERLTYREMIRKYAAVAGLQRRVALPMPMLTPWLSAQGAGLLTPLPRQLAVSLMKSLETDMVCANADIAREIPDPAGGLMHYELAVEHALAHVRERRLRTRWSHGDSDEAPSQPLPTDANWSGGPLYHDIREHRTKSNCAVLWRAIEAVVSERRGWSTSPLSWPLRGWISGPLSLAGIGRHPRAGQQLHGGESLDWWRVECIKSSRLIRLRADIPLPGRLWLELSSKPSKRGGAIYRQRTFFQPYGLAGQLFWTASAPLRDAFLGGIARDIVNRPNYVASKGKVEQMGEKKLRKGDKVEWQSHGITVPGTVEQEITSDTDTAGRKVRASKEEPQYKVRSDKSGRDAVHKPSALKRS